MLNFSAIYFFFNMEYCTSTDMEINSWGFERACFSVMVFFNSFSSMIRSHMTACWSLSLWLEI